METKKSARSKSRTKQEDSTPPSSSSDKKQSQDFVDKMKKRAKVTTHGIDNVSIILPW